MANTAFKRSQRITAHILHCTMPLGMLLQQQQLLVAQLLPLLFNQIAKAAAAVVLQMHQPIAAVQNCTNQVQSWQQLQGPPPVLFSFTEGLNVCAGYSEDLLGGDLIVSVRVTGAIAPAATAHVVLPAAAATALPQLYTGLRHPLTDNAPAAAIGPVQPQLCTVFTDSFAGAGAAVKLSGGAAAPQLPSCAGVHALQVAVGQGDAVELGQCL